MTEFQELVKDAPIFASMEHGELVAYAYGMYAAGAKAEAENHRLRELVNDLYFDLLGEMPESMLEDRRLQMRELGIEVDG